MCKRLHMHIRVRHLSSLAMNIAVIYAKILPSGFPYQELDQVTQTHAKYFLEISDIF